jgi:uncharacterized protein YbbC (DUF1343 family)
MPDVTPGLINFLRNSAYKYEGKSLGLLANQASVGPDYRHAVELIDNRLPGRLKTIFSPQHGYMGEKQDNMVPSGHTRLPDGRPVYSLYGDKRIPEDYMLEGLDVILVDLQDVGTRVYTFAQTLSLFMEKIGGTDIGMCVLDRPNPIGGKVAEGCMLDPDCVSFVGLQPVPLRHSLTMAELALYYNELIRPQVNLRVVPAINWVRYAYFSRTSLPWVMPSPNMPDPLTALLYAGTVIFEGTNLSEGRGTTRPFHMVGAPYVEPARIKKDLDELRLPAVAFREVYFQPCYNKWEGQVCGGVEIHPTGKKFKPFLTALSLLQAVLRRYPKDFKLKEPPYEYETERRPIDLILGRKTVFDDLQNGIPAAQIDKANEPEIRAFQKGRSEFLLYDDETIF